MVRIEVVVNAPWTQSWQRFIMFKAPCGLSWGHVEQSPKVAPSQCWNQAQRPHHKLAQSSLPGSNSQLQQRWNSPIPHEESPRNPWTPFCFILLHMPLSSMADPAQAWTATWPWDAYRWAAHPHSHWRQAKRSISEEYIINKYSFIHIYIYIYFTHLNITKTIQRLQIDKPQAPIPGLPFQRASSCAARSHTAQDPSDPQYWVSANLLQET